MKKSVWFGSALLGAAFLWGFPILPEAEAEAQSKNPGAASGKAPRSGGSDGGRAFGRGGGGSSRIGRTFEAPRAKPPGLSAPRQDRRPSGGDSRSMSP